MTDDSDGARSEKVGDRVSILCRNGIWQAQYMVGHRQVRKSLRTKSKKEARLRAIRIDNQLLVAGDRAAAPDPTIESLVAVYLDYLRVEERTEKTIQKYAFALRLLCEIAEKAKIKKTSQLSTGLVDSFRADRKAGDKSANRKPSSPKTIHHDTVLIRQLVNFAVRRGLVDRDPLAGLKIPKPRRNPQPCWTAAQVQQILAATAPPYRDPLTILSETGMRVGELKWLTWGDVDFRGRWIHVRPKPGWRPKSGNQRSVPMSTEAERVLRALDKKSPWVFPAPEKGRSGSTTKQISDRRLLAYLKRILKKLSLPGHVHTFRHAFISNAAVAGVAPDVLRKWVGHVDQATFDLYFHLANDASQQAMARLEEANRRLDATKSTTQNQHKEVCDGN